MDLLVIEIPKFITHVQLSKKRKAKYYTMHDEIPKRYSKCKFNAKGILVDDFGYPIIKNPIAAGTPKYAKINTQVIYRGNGHFTRSKMVHEMKEFFRDYICGIPPIDPKNFPLEIELQIHCPKGKGDFDVDNMSGIYTKTIHDCLVDCGLIPDDNINYIMKTESQYLPVKTDEERKLVIILRKNKPNKININEFQSA